jgi:small-conductance mechanosensitive channel
MLNYLHETVLGNEIIRYLTAIGIFVAGLIVVKIIKTVIFRRIENWASNTRGRFDDFIVSSLRRTLTPLLYFGLVYLSLKSLVLNPAIQKALTVAGQVMVTFVAVRLILSTMQFLLFQVWLKNSESGSSAERQAKALMPVITVFVWGLGVIFLLDNLGFKISTLVAGLGIGGVALALASQTVLGDMFSYFAIMLDKPFELDDFIILDNYMGTVEHIGIKTTRIRSLDGEQLVFSNKDLTDSRIRNYKRMQLRRVVFKFGVTYDTPNAKLKWISEHIKGMISQIKDTRFDRAHFFAFGVSDLTFEVVYFVLSADYNIYMDIQQEINLKLKESFEKEGIDFAFPTQIVINPNSKAREAASSEKN